MSWVITGMAVAGLAKSQLVDKPKEERQRKLAGETQRLSPWTHMQANPIQEADPFGSALQFGATGASMQQGYQNAQTQKALADRLNTGGNMVGYGKDMTKVAAQPNYLGADTTFQQPSGGMWDKVNYGI